MGEHVFVSYSRDDQRYVDRLARHLTLQGVEVWIDADIDYGSRWSAVIREQIDTCEAMLVVMTPAAEQSTWVEREIERAEHIGKPIHPLLLDGPPFFRLGHLHYADVRGGKLPPSSLIADLPARPVGAAARLHHLRGSKLPYARAGELPLLRTGDRGEWVVALQGELQRHGLELGAFGGDGVFGADTRRAVRRFQEEAGVDVDGVVGPQTWIELLIR